MDETRIHVIVSGRVQGVGFRYFTRETAQRLGVAGWVRNCPDGSVEFEAQAPAGVLNEFRHIIREGPTLAWVGDFRETEMPVAAGEKTFAVRF